VGFNKYWLDKLEFFEDFEETLYEMKELCEDEHTMYPKFAQALFGYDNETIWGFKAHMNDVPSVWLDGRWHTFLDKMTIIPSKSKLVHIINKSFDEVRDWYEKNNI